MTNEANQPTAHPSGPGVVNPSTDDPGQVAANLRRMVAEEMFLLGQELEDALDAGQQDRLDELTATLDEICELMTSHRRTRRLGPETS